MKEWYCDKCNNKLHTQDIRRSRIASGVVMEYIFCPRCGKRYMIILHDSISDKIRKEKLADMKNKLEEHQAVLETVYDEEIRNFIGT